MTMALSRAVLRLSSERISTGRGWCGSSGCPGVKANQISPRRAAGSGLSGIAAEASQPAALPALGELMPHSHVGAYALEPRADIVAVCDLIPERIAEFRSSWGDTYPEARPYADYREMLARE